MTAGDVIREARHELNDEDEPYRWEDRKLFQYLTDAQHELQRWRPDLYLAEDGLIATVAAVSSLDTPLPLEAGVTRALAYRVAAFALTSDGEDAANIARGADYVAKFLDLVVGQR